MVMQNKTKQETAKRASRRLCGCVCCCLVDLCDDNSNDDNNDDDEQQNEEAPPLLAVAAAGLDDGAIDFHVGSFDIILDFFALLLNVCDKRLLLLDNLVEVLEQLGKLHHLAFYVLDGFVSLLDVAQGGRGLATAVRVEELRKKKGQLW